ncbi:MAG TPA: xanthine dehydrogenase family protein molybdopterin-binding subunit [Stellaceae bacterium]|nr:xanthine dehydrogenase family protein molybdopterin-binding subunit [Stellaceae bacterium]
MGARAIGARVQRTEDKPLLTGQGRFVDDIHLPGTLEAAFLRATHAHARIRSVDAAAARAMPGVHAILTAADLPERMRQTRMPMLVPNPAISELVTQFCLARDEVCYVGEPLAIVVADRRHRAEDAAASILVDYEPLPAMGDCRDAVKPDAPRCHAERDGNIAARFTASYGDVDAAFGAAPHVFREELFEHRGCGHAIEARGVLARFDPAEDMLTVWSSTQTPHIGKATLADLLARDPERVRVIAPDVGGGFGPKAVFYAEDAVVAYAALHLGRPVKWIEDRREHFLAATQERDQYWSVEIAVDGAGKLLGVRGTMLHDTGAYVPWGIIMPFIAAATVPGPYVLPTYRLEVTAVYTNKVATTPVRGAGRPQAVFAMERLMDRAARELGLEPAEIRRRNFIAPSQMPYSVGLTFRDGKPLVYDSGDYPACQAKALELADHAGFPVRQKAARAAGRHIGIGIANYVEGTGLGPFEGVTVRVLQDGRVAVVSGAAPQGQGHKTTLAQICAERLDVPIERVSVTLGDTGAIAMGIGTFASRVTANAGPAALMASDEVRRQILALASRVLEADLAELALEDGSVVVEAGNRRAVGFGDLARIARGMPGFSFPAGQGPGLEHTAYFAPPQAAYCNGCHVVEVEVDVETGAVEILRYSLAHDSGSLINPLIVDGQIDGAVAHGIGNALYEWMRYDANAQPLTTSFADYLLPGASEVPPIARAHLETPSPLNPLGVKGAGEGGTIPAAAAIVAAVENALGIHITDTPIMPEKIVALMLATRI